MTVHELQRPVDWSYEDDDGIVRVVDKEGVEPSAMFCFYMLFRAAIHVLVKDEED